jgi:type I restriction enzyme, S subunit
VSGDVMAQAPLVQHFDLIAQAPGGVARLRELILILAVQGKLVPQDPSDEPASELLKKIRTEKDRLIAEGKITRDTQFPEITEDQKKFDLPINWAWCRLADLANLTYGKNLPTTKLTTSGFEVFGANGVIGFYSEYLYETPQLLISCRGAYSGKPNISPSRCYVTNNSIVCEFIAPALTSLDFQYRQIQTIDKSKMVTGSAQPQVTIANAGPQILALPPLAEQSRIVTRVEELMQLCDALEASGQLEAQQHAQLVNTLLGTLTQSETPEALADNWQRIATHFDLLLDRPEAVDALEQTILQLAVRGLLVPQDPTDEPASVLLQKIRTEKDHLIAQGKIKRDKPLPPITDAEKPFELPQGWEWVRLGSISEFTNGFAFPSSEFTSNTSGIGVIKIGDIQNGEVSVAGMSYVSNEYGEGVDRAFDVLHGDLLIAMSGATTGKLGFNRQHNRFLLNQRVGKIDLLLVDDQFAFQYLTTKILENLAISAGSAIPNLSTSQIKEIMFPLPPIAEQSRIVTCVNELRALCADVRQRLREQQTTQSHLADALLMQEQGN